MKQEYTYARLCMSMRWIVSSFMCSMCRMNVWVCDLLQTNFKPRILIWNARNYQYRMWNVFLLVALFPFYVYIPVYILSLHALPLSLLFFAFKCPKFTVYICACSRAKCSKNIAAHIALLGKYVHIRCRQHKSVSVILTRFRSFLFCDGNFCAVFLAFFLSLVLLLSIKHTRSLFMHTCFPI